MVWCLGLLKSRLMFLVRERMRLIGNSVEQSVRDDLHVLKTNLYITKELADNSSGFVYDIKTGLLTQVEYEGYV